MIKFNQFLTEGGHALPGVKPIAKGLIKNTFELYYKKVLKPLGFARKDIGLLGSAGKTPISGDLDIGIDLPAARKIFGEDDPAEILGLIDSRIKKVVKGTNPKGIPSGQLYTKFPIVGGSGYVQIDLMVGKLKYLKFSYYSGTSPDVDPNAVDVTQYKGVYRNLLLMAVARSVQEKITDTEYRRLIFNLSDGLYTATKTMIGKSGKIVKGHRTLEKKLMTDDPDIIVMILFGSKFTVADTLTYERLMKAIKSPAFKHKELRNMIFSEFKKALDTQKFPYPKGV